MRDGLGLRYAFMGPMETIHLNALGLKKYCQTYGETITNVSKTMGEIPSAWLMQTDEDKSKVFCIYSLGKKEDCFKDVVFSQIENLHQQMLEQIPMDQHYQACVRRDRNLAALAKLKRELKRDQQ